MPQLWFASPRVLPRADKLHGRVVVLDIAFAATIGTTRLVRADDAGRSSTGSAIGSPRGSITTITSATPSSRAIRGSCSSTKARARRVPRDGDAGAGAADRADRLHLHARRSRRAVRRGEVDPRRHGAVRGRRRRRARGRHAGRRRPGRSRRASIARCARSSATISSSARSCSSSSAGMQPGVARRRDRARRPREFERRDARTRALAKRFTIRGRVAVVDTAGHAGPVRQDRSPARGAGEGAGRRSCATPGMLTIAAPFDSGWDFVEPVRARRRDADAGDDPGDRARRRS